MPELEADIAETRAREPHNFERNVLPYLAHVVEIQKLPANHQLTYFSLGDIGNIVGINQDAVFQDCHPVGDLLDLFDSVRDIDDTFPVSFQFPYHREELLGFLNRNGGRRFIQDKYLEIPG